MNKKNYDRRVKESSLSPPGGIHTQESALASACHLQQGKIKPWVLNYTQQDSPDRRKEKDSKDMQGYLACGLIASAGSITKSKILLAVNIGSLTNHSM